jgi:ribosomal protein L40E
MRIAVEVIVVLLTLLFVLWPLLPLREEPAPEADIEAEIMKLRNRQSRTCPKCGSKNPADARFCSECASKLTKE